MECYRLERRSNFFLSVLIPSGSLGIDALLTNSAMTFGGVEIMMKHCRAILDASSLDSCGPVDE